MLQTTERYLGDGDGARGGDFIRGGISISSGGCFIVGFRRPNFPLLKRRVSFNNETLRFIKLAMQSSMGTAIRMFLSYINFIHFWISQLLFVLLGFIFELVNVLVLKSMLILLLLLPEVRSRHDENEACVSVEYCGVWSTSLERRQIREFAQDCSIVSSSRCKS